MPITAIPPLDRTSPTFRSDVDTFFGTRVPNFVSEANLLAANLNSIAAGGAYAIPFVNRLSANDVGGNGGILVIDGASQAAATRIVFDQVGSNNMLVQAAFDSLFSSTSAIKGYVRITKQGDASKWILFRVYSWVAHGGSFPYGELFGATISASSTNPFAYNDSIILQAQGNGDKGDKGDKGDSAVTGIIRVREERPSGTAAGTAAVTAWQVRQFNVVVTNTISGASLSGNQVTLPAGTYRFSGSVPASVVGAHIAQLYNLGDDVPTENGTSAAAATGEYVTSRSLLRGQFSIGAARSFVVRQWTSAAGSLGSPASAGTPEVYSEIQFEKIA